MGRTKRKTWKDVGDDLAVRWVSGMLRRANQARKREAIYKFAPIVDATLLGIKSSLWERLDTNSKSILGM